MRIADEEESLAGQEDITWSVTASEPDASKFSIEEFLILLEDSKFIHEGEEDVCWTLVVPLQRTCPFLNSASIEECVGVRGNTDRLRLVRDPLDGQTEAVCWPCLREHFAQGARVVMIKFQFRGRVHEFYLEPRVQEDIEHLRRIGEWAQAQGRNAVGFYLYRWKSGSHGAQAFSFGHEHSLSFLDETLGWLQDRLVGEPVFREQTSIFDFL